MKDLKQNAVKQQIFNFRESISQILKCDIYQDEAQNSKRLLNSHSFAQNGETLTTGFSELDRLFLNLRPSDLMVIASFPWMHVSELLISIAKDVAINQNKRIGIISQSISPEMMAARIIGNIVDVSPLAMREGWLTEDDLDRITYAKTLLDYESIIIATESIDGNALMKCIRNMKTQHDIESLFIDTGKKKWRDVTQSYAKHCMGLMASIKNIAVELKIPTIVSIDLPAKCEGCLNIRASLKDVEKYGCVDNVADIIALVHTDESQWFDNKDKMDITDNCVERLESEITVARNKGKSESVARLIYNRLYFRFENHRI